MMKKWQNLLMIAGLFSVLSCKKQDISTPQTLQEDIKSLFEKYHFTTDTQPTDTSVKESDITVASLAELEEQLKMIDRVKSSSAERNLFEQEYLKKFHKQYGDISSDTIKKTAHSPYFWTDPVAGTGFSYVRCMVFSGPDYSGIKIMDVTNNVNWRVHNDRARTSDVEQTPWNVSGAIPGSANPAADNRTIFEIGLGIGVTACRREFLYRFRVKLTLPNIEWEPGYTVRAHAYFNVGPNIDNYETGTIVLQ